MQERAHNSPLRRVPRRIRSSRCGSQHGARKHRASPLSGVQWHCARSQRDPQDEALSYRKLVNLAIVCDRYDLVAPLQISEQKLVEAMEKPLGFGAQHQQDAERAADVAYPSLFPALFLSYFPLYTKPTLVPGTPGEPSHLHHAVPVSLMV